jgi:hypothetical protein
MVLNPRLHGKESRNKWGTVFWNIMPMLHSRSSLIIYLLSAYFLLGLFFSSSEDVCSGLLLDLFFNPEDEGDTVL